MAAEAASPTRGGSDGTRGIVAALKGPGEAKGEQSIRVLQLEDEFLRQQRQEAQENGWTHFLDGLKAPGNMQDKFDAASEKIADCRSGRAKYSAAVCDYLDDYCRQLGNLKLKRM